MLKFQLFVTHSVKWSQLRRTKTCSVSWSKSGSTQSLQETITCSSVSSSLRWQIILNSGMIILPTSGTSLAASSTIKETSRRCSRSVKDMIVTSLCSVSQYQSWQTYGWVRSPRASDELSSPQDQVYHAIRMFNRIGDAINHLYYLRVAHSFMFNCHSESGHGRYYIYSGTLRGRVQDIPEVSEEARARILRIVIDKESMSFTDEVKFKRSSFTSSSSSIRSGQLRLRCSTSVRQLHLS